MVNDHKLNLVNARQRKPMNSVSIDNWKLLWNHFIVIFSNLSSYLSRFLSQIFSIKRSIIHVSDSNKIKIKQKKKAITRNKMHLDLLSSQRKKAICSQTLLMYCNHIPFWIWNAHPDQWHVRMFVYNVVKNIYTLFFTRFHREPAILFLKIGPKKIWSGKIWCEFTMICYTNQIHDKCLPCLMSMAGTQKIFLQKG